MEADMIASFLVAIHEFRTVGGDACTQKTFLGNGILRTPVKTTSEEFEKSLMAMLNSNTLQVKYFVRPSLTPQHVLSLESYWVHWESGRTDGGFGEPNARAPLSFLNTAEDIRVALSMIIARGFRDCLHVSLRRQRADEVRPGEIIVHKSEIG